MIDRETEIRVGVMRDLNARRIDSIARVGRQGRRNVARERLWTAFTVMMVMLLLMVGPSGWVILAWMAFNAL